MIIDLPLPSSKFWILIQPISYSVWLGTFHLCFIIEPVIFCFAWVEAVVLNENKVLSVFQTKVLALDLDDNQAEHFLWFHS
jgi:hypothetical protein